jgi:hypothetical protein
MSEGVLEVRRSLVIKKQGGWGMYESMKEGRLSFLRRSDVREGSWTRWDIRYG